MESALEKLERLGGAPGKSQSALDRLESLSNQPVEEKGIFGKVNDFLSKDRAPAIKNYLKANLERGARGGLNLAGSAGSALANLENMAVDPIAAELARARGESVSPLRDLISGVGKGVAREADAVKQELPETFGVEEGLSADLGRLTGGIITEGVLSLAGGGLLGKGVQQLAPASKLGQAIAAGSRGTLGQRVAAQTLPFAPVDAAIGAMNAPEGERLKGAATETGLGLLGGAALESIPTLIKGARNARVASKAKAYDTPDIGPLRYHETDIGAANQESAIARLREDLGYSDKWDPAIARRPGTPPARPVEPKPDAESQSFSGITFGGAVPEGVRRRAASDIPTVEVPKVDLTPPVVDEAIPSPSVGTEPIPSIGDRAVSFARQGPDPLVESVPGRRPMIDRESLKRARKAAKTAAREGELLPASPPGAALPPAPKRIQDAIDRVDTPTQIRADVMASEPPKIRLAKQADKFDEARMPSGRLRPIHRISDDALLRELQELEAKELDAVGRSQYTTFMDDNLHMTNDGRMVFKASRKGGGVSSQAKALQNLEDFKRIRGNIDKELKARGWSDEEISDRLLELSDLDAALERDALQYAESFNAADEAFDFPGPDGTTAKATTVVESGESRSVPKPPRPTDVLNVAKISTDTDVQKRLADQVEKFRGLRQSERKSWKDSDPDIAKAKAEAIKELSGHDPLAINKVKARKMSGEEIIARRDIVRENEDMIASLAKQVESGSLPQKEHVQAVELLDKLSQQNDQVLGDLVVASSQKGRDLNALRRLANRVLDVDTWMYQAKRLLGDQPLTDEMQDAIRKAVNEAKEVCGG